MELLQLLKIIKKRIWLPILLACVAAPTTFLLTGNQIEIYTSVSVLSMGLSGASVELQENAKAFIMARQRNNTLELARSRTVFEHISYTLLYHDLTSPEPYRTISPENEEYPFSQEQRGVEILDTIRAYPDSLLSPEDYKLLKTLLEARQYDTSTLLKSFKVHTIGESDYMRVIFEAENPDLVVQAISIYNDSFTQIYQNTMTTENIRSIDFFNRQVKLAHNNLQTKEDELKQLKEQNAIYDLNEQLKTIVAQRSRLELAKEEAQVQVESEQAKIWRIESQLTGVDESLQTAEIILLNENLIKLKDELKELEKKYLRLKFDQNVAGLYDLETQIAKKNTEIAELTNQLWLGHFISPQPSRTDLATQLLDAKIQYEIAQAKLVLVENELKKLDADPNKFAAVEAEYSRLVREINVAEQEYLSMVEKLHLARAYAENLQSSGIKIVEPPYYPVTGSSSQRMVLVVAAGMGAFIFGLVVLFALEYLDTSVRTIRQAEKAVEADIKLGLPFVRGKKPVKEWLFTSDLQEHEIYRESLRQIRNHIVNSESNSIVITSAKRDQGKTFTALNLALLFAESGSRIVLVDSNFRNPDISTQFKTDHHTMQSYFLQDSSFSDILHPISKNLFIIKSRQIDAGLRDMNLIEHFKVLLVNLNHYFDYIIIDTPSLHHSTLAEEIIPLTDKILFLLRADFIFDNGDKRALYRIKDIQKPISYVVNGMQLDFMDSLFGNVFNKNKFIELLKRVRYNLRNIKIFG